MGNLKLQAEVLQLSNYCEVIKGLLNNCEKLTLPKVIVYSYLIKKQNLGTFKIYSAKNTKDVTYKSLSLLSGDRSFFYEVEFIIKSIDLLIKNNIINYEKEVLFFTDMNFTNDIFDINPFLEIAINESEKISDKQFLKEVLSSV